MLDERDWHRVGAHTVARDAAGGVSDWTNKSKPQAGFSKRARRSKRESGLLEANFSE